jgi:hypothetical protein
MRVSVSRVGNCYEFGIQGRTYGPVDPPRTRLILAALPTSKTATRVLREADHDGKASLYLDATERLVESLAPYLRPPGLAQMIQDVRAGKDVADVVRNGIQAAAEAHQPRDYVKVVLEGPEALFVDWKDQLIDWQGNPALVQVHRLVEAVLKAQDQLQTPSPFLDELDGYEGSIQGLLAKVQQAYENLVNNRTGPVYEARTWRQKLGLND